MSKYCGLIGYSITEESPTMPGVFLPKIVEIKHFGDIVKERSKWEQTTYQNDNITISNKLSIVANSYISENYGYMKYAVINGVRWTITNISLEYPRVILTLGGVYNGPEPV